MSIIPFEEMLRIRHEGDQTPSGVWYDWDLAGPDGIAVTIVKEAHHTDEDIERAKQEIRNDRDVVSMRVRQAEKL